MNTKNPVLLVLWYDLFRTNRRARRSEFWQGFLFVQIFPFFFGFFLAFVVAIVLFPITLLIGASGGLSVGIWQLLLSVLGAGAIIGGMWSLIAWVTLTIRRLHDLNLSGWWYVALLASSIIIGMLVAPFAGLIFEMQKPPVVEVFASVYYLGLFVIGVSPPSAVNNRWGPGPTAM